MARIVTLGEIMLRLKSPALERFFQSPSLEATFGGGEANVAVSLANYGMDAAFVTALPNNAIGEACLRDVRSFGVDVSNIKMMDGRMGIYFLETGSNQRPSKVVYDRADSCIAKAPVDTFDWKKIFDGATWFHITGITPAISQSAADLSLAAVKAAKEMGVTVSCDLNYRKNLWKYGKEPQEVLPPLMEQCDAFFGTDDEYEKVLGMQLPQFAARDAAYRPDTAGYERASAEVAVRFPRCRSIVFGLRSVLSANHHLISGTLYTGGRLLSTRVYDIDPVVDCVGVGDAFVGGLLYGMAAHPHDAQFALDFGTAACALKNTVPGDYNQFTAAEVEQLARGSVSGRIAR